ncbi:MAG: hypothetical protein IT287_00700 [Bdellovibrionaceae bacterium]|nr:hypothetical protein [Pseudobdellovibrionaceae bacterium]
MNNYKEHFRKMKSNSHPVRMKSDKKSRSSAKSKNLAPLKMGCFMALALCVSAYGFLYPESLLELADRVTVFSMSQAKDSASSADLPVPNKEDVAAAKSTKSPLKKAEAMTEVSDNANYIQYLEERKKTLDEKEKQLKDLEEKLQLEKVALEKKVEELEVKRRDIASKLEGRVQEDEESVKKLVDMYSNMKPQSAAQVIASLDDELAINILKRMKKQEAGSILNYMPPQKAKLLSEKYTGY